MFGVKMRGGGAQGRPELGAPHRCGDRDGWRKKTSWRRPCESSARGAAVFRLTNPWSWSPLDRVLLVVAIHLEYHRLCLDVLHEAPGDGGCDVLHVIEVERGSLAAVLQRLSGEGLVVTIDKTLNKFISMKIKYS